MINLINDGGRPIHVPDLLGICANGPAIWGGCVTRRKHRHKSVPVGQKAVTVQGGYGAVFAVMVQGLSKLGVSRYNVDRSRYAVTGLDYC